MKHEGLSFDFMTCPFRNFKQRKNALLPGSIFDFVTSWLHKNTSVISCISSTKSTFIDSDKVNVVFNKDKSASIYENKTQTKYRGNVKTTLYSFPDENMVLVHGGSFEMGSMEDEKQGNKTHTIVLHDFYIDKH